MDADAYGGTELSRAYTHNDECTHREDTFDSVQDVVDEEGVRGRQNGWKEVGVQGDEALLQWGPFHDRWHFEAQQPTVAQDGGMDTDVRPGDVLCMRGG